MGWFERPGSSASRVLPRSMKAAACALLVATIAVTVGSTTASARTRAVRQVRNDLAELLVERLVQDADGYLWIGTPAGLFRYDGVEMQPWHRDLIGRVVERLLLAPSGRELYVVERGGGVYHVRGDRAEEVFDAGGAQITGVTDLVSGAEGDLWIVSHRRLLGRAADGTWTEPWPTGFGEERPHRLHRTPAGELLVSTGESIWRITDGAPRRFLAVGPVIKMETGPDGTLWLLQFEALQRYRDGALELVCDRETLPGISRLIDIAFRNDTVWVSQAENLIALHPDGELEVLAVRDEPWAGGGPLLVDRDGSLWLGNGRGLFNLPEPDTQIFGELDGLPRGNGRFLARGPEGVWVTTWYGAGVLRAGGATGYSVDADDFLAREQPCADDFGAVWLAPANFLIARRDGAFERFGVPQEVGGTRCARAPDGTVWFLKAGDLYRSGPPGTAPRRYAHAWGPVQRSPDAVLHDSHGRLWVARDDEVCFTEAATLDQPGAPAWACPGLPVREGSVVRALVEADGGQVWAAISDEGVYRFADGRWQLIAASNELPGRWLFGMHRSPRGGVWISARNFTARVEPSGDAGWRVVETLGWWHGLMNAGSSNLLEDDDGTLWLAGSGGVIRVPPHVRFAPRPAPEVILVRARADGRDLDPHAASTMGAGTQHVELEFRALAFREPSSIRYRVRLRPDAPWSAPMAQAALNLLGLAPGSYRVEVAASADGVRWSQAPAVFAFRIAPPWYRRWWAWTLFASATVGLLYALHAARVAVLLRLQRQRARIANDLHDEMGSGLGSIGILADLMEGGTLSDVDTRELSARIRSTSAELSSSLAEIVYSLRRGSTPIGEMVAQLRERGSAFFAGAETRFCVNAPAELPPVSIPVTVCRNVQLTALEALHNAARHAGAGIVTLGLAPSEDAWHLWIEDDGCGLGNSRRAPGSGMGMASMHKRAKTIGAVLRIGAGPNGGTRIDLWFRIDARIARAPAPPRAIQRRPSS